jgi:hypothetical protein
MRTVKMFLIAVLAFGLGQALDTHRSYTDLLTDQPGQDYVASWEEVTITGTIRLVGGDPLPGVTVVAEGTDKLGEGVNVITVTDELGAYAIKVPKWFTGTVTPTPPTGMVIEVPAP